MTFQRHISALLVICTLFASIARAPGVMLSVHDGVLTFEICTGDGIQTITTPSEETPTQPDCEFFAAQIAALLGGVADTLLARRAFYVAQWPVSQSAFVQSATDFAQLIRGPPLLS